MELPSWLWQRHLLPASAAALRVALAVCENGRPHVGKRGRGQYLRTTRPKLAKLAGQSPRSTDAGINELVDAGVLWVDPPLKMRAPTGFTLALIEPTTHADFAGVRELQDGGTHADFAGVREFGGSAHDDDDVDLSSPTTERSIMDTSISSNLSREERAQILRVLSAAGVDNPSSWTTRFGWHEALRAIEWATSKPGVSNPAGLAFRQLSRGLPIPDPPPPQPDRDSYAARLEHYTAGPLGQFVRTK